MEVDGFFPKDSTGNLTAVFTNFAQAQPLITFLLSVATSSFGMSKFFLVGPLRLIPGKTPFSGMLSLTFLANLFINLSFVFRLYAIEHIFLSSYRKYSTEESYENYGTVTSSIEPIISYEFRLLAYFIPILPSLLLNLLSLRRSLAFKPLLNMCLVFPQYFITSCFTPLVFEGITIEDEQYKRSYFKIKVWKLGSVLNTFYLIFMPQLILVVSDVSRGVTSWNFIRMEKFHDYMERGFIESDSSILKYPFGNVIFAITVCIVCMGVLIFLVSNLNKLFIQHSDALAFRSHDSTKWEMLWIRDQPIRRRQTEDHQVFIIKFFQ